MRKVARMSAAAVCVWSLFAMDLQGAPERGTASGIGVSREKPCPPFLSADPGSPTPWCRPRGDFAGRSPLGFDLAERPLDLPPRIPEGSTDFGTGAGSEGVLLGVTWDRSLLVSFDPTRGEILKEHARLNPDLAFTALAYDRLRHRLYALSQGELVLTIIDTDTLQTIDIVQLRVDRRAPGLTDTVALALDPATDTLYTIVGHWPDPLGPIRSELATIDPATGELTIVGRIDGPWFASLAFSETDRQLYGTGVYGAGPWDSPYPTHVLRIDPATAESEAVLVTPYHTMLGLAVREPFSFFSWINWSSSFYGRTDLPAGTVTPMGSADDVGVVYAMIYRNFPLPARAVPIPPAPVSFLIGGSVSDVWDPEGRLAGRVREGHRFSGQFSYDAAAPVEAPDPNHSSRHGISLAIGGFRYASTGLTASITNDRYDWDGQSLTDAFLLAASADPPAGITWSLFDPSGEALQTSIRLPRAFDLSDWADNRLTVVGYDECCEGPVYAFSGTVDRIARRDRRSPQAPLPPKPQPDRRLSRRPG